MTNEKIISADYLLLLLYLNDKSNIVGALRLVKMMFLFEQEINIKLKNKIVLNNDSSFMAYSFGPVSKDLYEQLNFFESLGFINIETQSITEEMGDFDNYYTNIEDDNDFELKLINDNDLDKYNAKVMYTYSLTDSGTKFVVEKIIPSISVEERDILESFKKRILSLSIRQILYYVYTKYPKFTINSVIKKDIIG